MALDAACEHVSADGSVAKYRQRSAYVAAYVLDRANGFCGVCGRPAPFRRPDGGAYLEPHHVIRLSDDDPDHPSMVTAACPACHRRVHYGEDGQATNNRLKAHVPAVEQAIADGRFIIVTAAAIRNDDGRVLIVQKGGHGTIAGKWESPCGKAELGETLEGCLKRATLEELGDSPCPRPFSLGVKAAVRREMMPNLRVAGHHRTCRKTVRFSLRPTLKIGPIAAGRRRMNQALHSRVLKDSMVTLYSSASGFLIARRATASWFNLSKWSATLKAAPSQLAAAG